MSLSVTVLSTGALTFEVFVYKLETEDLQIILYIVNKPFCLYLNVINYYSL